MTLQDYIQNNSAFWKDVESIGLVKAFNKWFLFDDMFAELVVDYIENMSMSGPKDNWDEYSKGYVENFNKF